MGFLPYDLFPRHGRWPDLAPTALVYHMTLGCVQARGHRGRGRVRGRVRVRGRGRVRGRVRVTLG